MIKTIKIDNEEYVRKADIKQEWKRIPSGDESNPYMEIGKDYFIRTVTHYFTGRLEWVGEKEIVLIDVCWIADTGRFSDAVAKAEFGEVEPFPDGKVIIGRGAIIDAMQIKSIPRSRK